MTQTIDTIGQKSLTETVWDLLDADADLNENVKYLVLAAMDSDQALSDYLGGGTSAHQRPEPTEAAAEPAGAFLRSITVAGFRGIGPAASLDITPYPGITVVSGRNGSGKSSFAEALEYALTGESYRWRAKKSQLWADSWRNLHQGNPCEVQVDFTVEDGPSTSIGASWSADASLDDAKRWSQRTGEKREVGVDALGWSTAIEIHRPILSYDEIGGLLEQEPSKLYDALDKLLALDEVLDAETRLTAEYTARRQARKTANDARTALKKAVVGIDDPAVVALAKILRPNKYDLDAIANMVSGVSGQHGGVDALRVIVEYQQPDVDASALAAQLRDALVNLRTLADSTLERAEQRTQLLSAALEFRTASGTGSVACPVCEQGVLDAEWEAHARVVIDQENEQLALYREARQSIQQLERSARSLLSSLPDIAPLVDVELASLDAYRAARAEAIEAVAVEDLPLYLEEKLPAVHAALGAVQADAAAALDEHQSVWAPMAERTMEWVALERTARETDDIVAVLDAAKKWVSNNAQLLREQRLEPIAEGARAIWAQLRQESDVDVSTITLEGKRTHRKAILQGTVDGEPAGALSVMSQGELHALALALFLPRATASSSPFRFIVLDDPIQAMDPAKIDGFLNVLRDLAKTRQIIVFSHDDRLATAIRQQSIEAHLIEVSRESGSRLVVKPAEDPARRYVEDAYAVVVDDNVPDDVKQRACPALFRLAIESAARQRFFTWRNADGESQRESEKLWGDFTKMNQRVALALEGDASANISGWRSWRDYRGPALFIANKGTHEGSVVTKDNVRDLRKTVADLLEGK